MEVLLEVSGLKFHIGKRKILDDLNITLLRNSCVGIYGENGAGKSSFFQLLLNSANKTWAKWKVPNPKISFLGHSLGLYLGLSVGENLEFFQTVSRGTSIHQETIQLLGLQKKWDDPVFSLSRGWQQRVAIARALMSPSDLLILDEPFTGLDESAIQNLLPIFSNLKTKKTLLVSSHTHEAKSIYDQIRILKNGKFQ